jgi:hypothetical protein
MSIALKSILYPFPLTLNPLCEAGLGGGNGLQYRNGFKTHCGNVFAEGEA